MKWTAGVPPLVVYGAMSIRGSLTEANAVAEFYTIREARAAEFMERCLDDD